jgi:hypothetical protein
MFSKSKSKFIGLDSSRVSVAKPRCSFLLPTSKKGRTRGEFGPKREYMKYSQHCGREGPNGRCFGH